MSDAIGALTGTSTTTNNNNVNAITENTLGKEDFLNLLVTQMQYQDPLDPMDNEQFVAQMAQFSSLEQLINLNETMGEVQLLETSINNSQAVNLIGKTVKVLGNAVQIQDGKAGSFDYALLNAADKVTISIWDKDGALVRSIEAGSKGSGEQTTEFDGKDDEGNQLADGDYTYTVTALDADGNTVDVLTTSEVVIDAVTFDSGSVWLMSGDSLFSLSDVIEVRGEDGTVEVIEE